MIDDIKDLKVIQEVKDERRQWFTRNFWISFIPEFPYTLYKWKSDKIFKDWEGLFSSLETIKFECVDELIDYYYDHEYHDEAADFL